MYCISIGSNWALGWATFSAGEAKHVVIKKMAWSLKLRCFRAAQLHARNAKADPLIPILFSLYMPEFQEKQAHLVYPSDELTDESKDSLRPCALL